MHSRNLSKELGEFEGWLRRTAMPGFMAYATDTYFPDDRYVTYADELQELADRMKDAIRFSDPKEFSLNKSFYKKYFSDINIALCRELYDDMVERYEESDHSMEDAHAMALEHVWMEQRVRYWLPIYALLKDGKGREVCLVSRKEHTPKGSLYVTFSDLEFLGSSGRDPWEFVQQRGVAS